MKKLQAVAKKMKLQIHYGRWEWESVCVWVCCWLLFLWPFHLPLLKPPLIIFSPSSSLSPISSSFFCFFLPLPPPSAEKGDNIGQLANKIRTILEKKKIEDEIEFARLAKIEAERVPEPKEEKKIRIRRKVEKKVVRDDSQVIRAEIVEEIVEVEAAAGDASTSSDSSTNSSSTNNNTK